ncbi:MAG: hypothetical protein O7J95_08280 [Planctomycetota bacterium]|nr:hypothetical protein [Planctomycetota bacterium]
MDALTRKERETREKVFELAVGPGPSDDAVNEWSAARQEYAHELRSLPPEEAQRVLAAELDAIASQLSRLEESGSGGPDDAFRSAVLLGDRLRWALWLADFLSDERVIDPLVLLEEELERVETQGRNLFHLDSRLEERALDVTLEARKERLSLLRCRLQRFVRSRPDTPATGALEEATARWLAAIEAFQIQSDTVEKLELDGPLDLEPDDESGIEDLKESRRRHLEACSQQLRRCTNEEVEEFVQSSVSDLLDQISGILSEGEASVPSARLEVLDLMRERIGAFFELLGERRAELSRRGVLGTEDRRRFRQNVRQLAKARKQLLTAESETEVQKKLEATFGRRNVRLFENFILVLIFALLGLVYCEWRLPGDVPRYTSDRADDLGYSFFCELVVLKATGYFNVVDVVFCLFFQIDFFVRWAFARWRGSYFRRHFFFESLPALPYGFIFHNLGLMEELRAVILVRLVRLRSALRLRAFILVFLRLFRVAMFFVRGVDRAVEKFRHFIDRDIVLFEQDPLADAPESPIRRRAFSLEGRRQRFLRNVYSDVRWSERGPLLHSHARIVGAEARMCATLDLPYRRGFAEARGEIHIEQVIHNFLDCDVTRALGMVGREGAERISRWLRFLDVPGFRSAPFIRRLIPAARIMNPAEAVSAAANAMGRLLQELLGVVRFWADMSGITTGPQILDRVGTALVAASRRPAVRLLLFGCLVMFLKGLLTMMHVEVLEAATRTLTTILGMPLLILGSICLVFLLLGRWLKRISGEALDQYLRTADAQFYPLVKARKFLRFEADLKTLYESVLEPETRLRCAEDVPQSTWLEFLEEPIRERARFMPGRIRPPEPPLAEFGADREVIVMLYRDFLDGPVLHRRDDKTSVQLLGNLSLQEIRSRTLGMTPKEMRKLERLVLEKGNILAFGPYFWFRFITESLAIETAKLIAEYNAVCIPSERLHLASPESRERFADFLAEHRSGASGGPRRARQGEALRDLSFSSASFTAFDFLGASEESDEVVRQRYGDDVLEALRRDRRAVVRDIFGTRPYHLLPRHRRVLNPYRLYRRYLGGAKFFFLPFVFTYALIRLQFAGISQIRELVYEVLGTKRVRRSHLSREAAFDVAVRKINRMRKPLFMEALRLRVAVDVEYLGLRIPGEKRVKDGPTYQEDLEFIGAPDTERRPIEKLRGRAVRDLRRFRVFLSNQGWSGRGFDLLLEQLDPSGDLTSHRGEVMRAIVTAYVTDHGSLRSILTAPEWIRAFIEKALRATKRTVLQSIGDSLLCNLFVFLPRNRRRRRLFREFVRLDATLDGLEPGVRKKVLVRLLRADRFTESMLESALRCQKQESEVGEDALLAAFKRAACDYKLWTRKIITVRTVQSLSVLDVRHYRKMVWEIGDYEKDEKTVAQDVLAPERSR